VSYHQRTETPSRREASITVLDDGNSSAPSAAATAMLAEETERFHKACLDALLDTEKVRHHLTLALQASDDVARRLGEAVKEGLVKPTDPLFEYSVVLIRTAHKAAAAALSAKSDVNSLRRGANAPSS
jgi:hypothetical protein